LRAREDERAAFLGLLCSAACDDRRRSLVLVALRGDFYMRFASYPRFAELLSSRHVLVGPMDRDELAQAIEQPAARAGLEIERPLATALVSEAAEQTGGLPLLSAMLVELWRARDERWLRYQSYRASGGMQAAVARLAEETYARLAEPQRRVAHTVMLRLGEHDGALVRRRAPVAELERIDGANPVVAALIDARLLTLSDGRVELSHEALLREWPRYHSWLEEDRAGRRLHAHLTAAAGEWEAQARDPGELYRGARLAAALDWDAHHGERLNSLEREFLDRSRLEADRDARRRRAQNRRLRGLLLGVGVLLTVAVLGGVLALVKQQSASNEARVALARQLGAEAVNQPRLDLAMLLAREAVNLDRSPQTEGTLLTTLQRIPAVIGTFALPVDLAPQLAVSPDGDTLAVSHFLVNDYGFSPPGVSLGYLRFYDPRTRTVQRAPLTDFGGAGPPVYSNDGSLLAYPTGDTVPSIAVRDARTLALISKLTLDPFQIATQTPDIAHSSILIATDARTVYCAYRVYETEHNAPNALVNADAGATYLARWSLRSGRLLSSTPIDSGAVLAVRLIDAGARLLVVDARTGDARPGIGAHGTAVTTLTYSPDRRAVVSTGDSNEVIVWDPSTATSAEVLTAPAEQVQGIAFSPDGATLYTSSLGGLVLEWDLTGGQSFGRRFTLGMRSPCCGALAPLAPPLALSPDGTRFAVRLGPSTVGLFSTRTMRRQALFTITPKGAAITALAWSPIQPELAVAGHSGLVQLWQVDGGPRLARSPACNLCSGCRKRSKPSRFPPMAGSSRQATAARRQSRRGRATWPTTGISWCRWRSGEQATDG
jgi:WD40 repeat protein